MPYFWTWKKFIQLCVLLTFSTTLSVHQVLGHGYMIVPPARNSMWRFGYHTPINYDDNGLNCGGFSTQWSSRNRGRCGICGDSYSNRVPRNNEDGGKFGLGIIVGEFRSESVVNVTVHITAPHMGYFKFSICNLDSSHEVEECFQPLFLTDGSRKFGGISKARDYTVELKLPPDLKCEHCSLRWHYRAGNNINFCPRGGFSNRCGPQETFRNCADISIY